MLERNTESVDRVLAMEKKDMELLVPCTRASLTSNLWFRMHDF